MIAICLCFKDSAAYLDEWLRFHYVQGVRKFYLYDNGSSDDWKSVVEPWTRRGLIEAFTYLGLGVQAAIYDDCLRRASGAVEWLAFIDDDEFLFSPNGRSLAHALQEYEEFAGVAVSWVLFGSGGAEHKSPEWVIESFRVSSGAADGHVKCVVRPERVIRSKVIGHAFEPQPGFHLVDENGIRITEALSSVPSVEKLRINHYLVKSWDEWRFRRQRPQADTGAVTPHPEKAWREWDLLWSRVPDFSASIYAPTMRSIKVGEP